MGDEEYLIAYADFVAVLAEDMRPAEIFEYACQQPGLTAVVGARLGLPVRQAGPETTGDRHLGISDRFLQLLEEEQVDPYLAGAAAQTSHAVFIIATTFCQEVTASGANRYRCIQSAGWWLDKLRTVYPCAIQIPSTIDTLAMVITWTPSVVTLERAVRIKIRQGKEEKMQARIRQVKNSITCLYRPPISERRIIAELSGRHVAIVGNAQSLSEREYGRMIDRADIVIRCNRGPIIHTRSHGGRTDWLCTSLPLSREQAGKRGITQILWMSRSRKAARLIPRWLVKSKIFYRHPKRRHRQLATRIGAPPSTGVMGIDLVARSRCSSLEIFGFDFSASKSFSNLGGSASKIHNADLEQDYVRKLVAADNRIRIYP